MFCCILTSYLTLIWTTKSLRNEHDDERKQLKFNLRYLFVNPHRLALIGALRFSTVILGLVALWYIPVSFAEMVKSSAPIFTVIISLLVLREKISLMTLISIVPIMVGLALCSAYEIQFNTLGFMAVISAILSESLQTVLAKEILILDKYEPNQIQLFTSVYSLIFQFPYLYHITVREIAWNKLSNGISLLSYLICGLSFHFQSLTEYALLNIISPVSHSVANTVKRAFLIWLSVIVFGNSVTIMSWIGTFLLIFGVLLYNKTRIVTETASIKKDDEKKAFDRLRSSWKKQIESV
ncbi:hypothetical protein NH340_JMT01801 [Sarcoptes scabiei]|nr:hypothetical protein NH340_JMT01801 [Sarcoptes scabiei]